MSFDPVSNFGISTVSVAPVGPTDGLSLAVADPDLFPDPGTAPFNLVVWPAGVQPLSSNAEIVRATAGGSLWTIQREQEGTNARAIQVGDQIALNITALTLTSIEGAVDTNTSDIASIEGIVDTNIGDIAALQTEVAALPGDSRLNLALNFTNVSPQTFPANTQVPLTWQQNGAGGADISLDSDTETIHFNTEGTYLLRLRWGMSTIVNGALAVELLSNLSGGAIVGGDSIQASVSLLNYNRDETCTWLWRVNAGATLVMGGSVNGGTGPETGYDITLDIVRVA